MYQQEDAKAPNYQVRSVSRALDILKCFTPTRVELSLSEISDLTELNKSTVLRLLDCLIQEGFVEQNVSSAKYMLGLKVFEMGMVYYVGQLKIGQMAKPYMQALAYNTRLTVNLAMLDKDEIVYIAIEEPETIVRIHLSVGSRTKAANTSLGKVLMAQLSDERVDEILKTGNLQQLTKNSITDEKIFRETLKTVKKQGYATEDEEVLVGVRCMAMPILDYTGRVVAAMSISGTIFDFTHERDESVLRELKIAADGISQKLGYQFNLSI